MEELQLSLTPARVDHRNAGILLANWRVGQILNALVVNSQPNGSVLLSVGGKSFVASTDIPVQPGTHLNLEVKQLGEQVILRQIGNALSAQEAAVGARLATAAQTPASTGLASLLTQLAATGGRLASPELTAAAKDLLGRGLKADNLSAAQLRDAVRGSGLFAEAQLATGQPAQAQQSPKGALSTLQQLALALVSGNDAEALDGPELQSLLLLAERAGASLNGVVNQQLASLPQENSPPRWVVTLPLALEGQYHDVHLTIQRDDSGAEQADEQSAWRVSVRLDLPRLGAVDVTVMLRGEQVNVGFSCGQPATSRWLGRSLNQLAQRLERQDFTIERIETEVMPAAAADASGPENGTATRIEVLA